MWHLHNDKKYIEIVFDMEIIPLYMDNIIEKWLFQDDIEDIAARPNVEETNVLGVFQKQPWRKKNKAMISNDIVVPEQHKQVKIHKGVAKISVRRKLTARVHHSKNMKPYILEHVAEHEVEIHLASQPQPTAEPELEIHLSSQPQPIAEPE